MDEIIKIWDLIVKSNTFNFAILLLIFAILASKMKLGEKLEALREAVAKTIESAQLKKEEAAQKLSNARHDVENLDEEIDERLSKAKESASHIAEEILKDAGEKARKFEAGISKRIETEEKIVSTALSKQTAVAAVELAKDHIKNLLENNRDFHKKFINESIEELDRINL